MRKSFQLTFELQKVEHDIACFFFLFFFFSHQAVSLSKCFQLSINRRWRSTHAYTQVFISVRAVSHCSQLSKDAAVPSVIYMHICICPSVFSLCWQLHLLTLHLLSTNNDIWERGTVAPWLDVSSVKLLNWSDLGIGGMSLYVWDFSGA